MIFHTPWHPTNRRELLHFLPKGGICAEIGVHVGNFANVILGCVKPETLYLVDKWPDHLLRMPIPGGHITGTYAKQVVEQRFAEQIQSGIVKVIHCDSLAVGDHIPPRSLDWVYLDTSHVYPATLLELRELTYLLKPGGLLLGHDYNIRGVEKSIKEFVDESNYHLTILTSEPIPSFVLTSC
jgi:hypothetical protein